MTRHTLGAMVGFVVAWAGPGMAAEPAASPETVTLVHDGVCLGRIVLDPDPERRQAVFERRAVELLQHCVEKATGAALPEAADADASNGVRLVLSYGPYARSHFPDLDDIDIHGFVIAFPEPDAILIAGSTAVGVYYGAVEFVERYLGSRFLLPGPDWEVIPATRNVCVPRSEVRDAPLFLSRCTSFQTGKHVFAWGNRSRCGGQVHGGSHYLSHVFPPAEFAEKHPEVYPIIRGRRHIPRPDQRVSWQPCFSEPKAVDIAVAHYLEEFAKWKGPVLPPRASMGVNDGPGFCECERCRRINGNRLNSMGSQHQSNTYHAWANQVIERVLEKHPDALFSFIAYYGLMEPPDDGKVHPHLVPNITFDRYQWAARELREKDQWITARWAEVAPQIQWYVYNYGATYAPPRVYWHLMAEYLRWGYEHNVRHLRGETYPAWSTPKPYIMQKLRWNPYADVDALLEEWCEAAVGKTAAPSLIRFYAHLEEFWTARVRESSFLKRGASVYMAAVPQFYLDVLTDDDVAFWRARMEEVVAQAGTPAEQMRAAQLMQAFEGWEAVLLCFLGDQGALATHVDTEQSALKILPRATELFGAKTKAHVLAKTFKQDEYRPYDSAINRYYKCWGDGMGSGLFWHLLDPARSHAEVRAGIVAALGTTEPAPLFRDHAGLLLRMLDGTAKPLLTNTDFANRLEGWDLLNVSDPGEPEGAFSALWINHPVPGAHMAWDGRQGHGGQGPGCVLARFVGRGIVRQLVTLDEPGQYLALGFVKVDIPMNAAPDAVTAKLAVSVGYPIENVTVSAKSRPPVREQWFPLTVVFRMASRETTKGSNRVVVQGQPVIIKMELRGLAETKGSAWIDDLAIYRLGDVPTY